ncbi:Thioredoxin F-type [Morus notabilis]|uniref:Thioredoxin F-type n=1 Tax=Morus notabilis TaxID=981085 RepID=W9S6Z2_9ROSA|nr:thioredoxin F-type, chloroplastic [Morus notabilis]EXC29957.1 Thioredoxin F-type [Morus notabilis]
MALRSCSTLSPQSVRSPPSLPCAAKQQIALPSSSSSSCFGSKKNVVLRFSGGAGTKRAGSYSRSVRSSLETLRPTVGKVTEVNKDSFWPIVNAAGDKTVVLDMYTQWCGPCKVIAPKFQELSEKYLDVVFLKLDCNQDNKALAKELGIRVVPTFKILKDSKIVKEVTGAKFDDLVVAIDTVRSS